MWVTLETESQVAGKRFRNVNVIDRGLRQRHQISSKVYVEATSTSKRDLYHDLYHWLLLIDIIVFTKMARRFPSPWLSTLVCGGLYMIIASIFPHQVPKIRPSTALLTFAGVNFSLWAFWKVFLYPTFFSPLRHLPSPKV